MHLKPIGDKKEENHRMSQDHSDKYHSHKHHSHEEETHSMDSGDYYCPMHCEGDETYNEPGDCPECGMHLNKKVTVESRVEASYTCPMHPEVKQDHPGSCPKCGMDLVPEKVENDSEEEKAYKRMAKKFWIALAFSIPVFVIAMSELFSFLHLEDIASKRIWGWGSIGSCYSSGILLKLEFF